MANTLLQILKDNISDPSVFFVFPTQVAADAWADALLDSLETGTVAMERFTAWDTFKGSSIRSQKQDKTSVPSVLRKLFAARLIAENAVLVKEGREPFFRALINPDYAQEASSFTNWISGLLPQLALWKKKQKAAPTDPEDVDLERLYEAYRTFLEEKKLFDPAWETPPFDARGNRYILFYPEILEDFAEYQDLLEESENITLIKAEQIEPLSCSMSGAGSGAKAAGNPDAGENAASFIRTFDNSRAELHALALEIKRSHEEDNIPYEDMAVSIDRDGLLLPYLERELSLYCIPVKRRIAQPLTARGAGLVFTQIQECVSSNFSFEAVKDLLLNNDLPWKEKQLNMELINFGIRNSCICSFEKDGSMFDVWKNAFKAFPQEERLSTFYDRLKRKLTNISDARTFKDIEDGWFAFRSEFFNEDAFTAQADNVLGRCLKELAELIRIQTDYPDMQIKGCYSFFTEQLESTEYLAQSAATGVVLYPYRNAAAAPKARHFVPAAGQDAVTVTYSPLRFLSQEKRARLGVDDYDVSAIFLKMYGQNSAHGTWYSCAEKSFSGYTLPHSALASKKAEVPGIGDPLAEQRAWFIRQQMTFPATISETDKAGFAAWSSHASELSSPDTALQGISKEALYEGDFVRVSESALADFFFCPRYWYYSRCLKLKPFTLEADLMEDVWVGTLYHKILETFFSSVKATGNGQILNPDNPEVWEKYLVLIDQAVNTGIEEAKGSPLSKELLMKQKDAYAEKVQNCLLDFCRGFSGCQVVATERDLTMIPENKNYLFNGKIDLVLRNTDETIVLIDFKTGNSPPKKKCFPDKDDENKLENFQFAMYIKLWEHDNPDSDDAVSECHFYEIGNCTRKTIIGKTSRDSKYRQDMEPSIHLLEQYADLYAEAVASRSLKNDIQPSFKDCSGCRFKAVCRTTYTVSGDKALIAAQEEVDDE